MKVTADPKLMAELRRDVDKLAVEVGERHSGLVWEIAEVADYLALELESAAYEVERQGLVVDAGRVVVQNLSAKLRGGSRGDESLVIATYYDSAPGSRGADDNATGTAAVLALARQLRDARPDRTLRFVFLVNEQEPFAGTELMGSLHFARLLASGGERVAATLVLSRLGASVVAKVGARGVSVGLRVEGPSWADPLVARVSQLLARSIQVSVARTSTGRGAAGFWQAGIPAVVLSSANDGVVGPGSESTIDYAAMARRVDALAAVVTSLAAVSDPQSATLPSSLPQRLPARRPP